MRSLIAAELLKLRSNTRREIGTTTG